tara:strand:+ start:69 stop:662 length:594 start_codon:yes stop_codon:yes gene_type:complete
MIDIGKITDLKNFNPVPVNRYVAKIFCPITSSINTETLAMRVESAELPGKTITTSDARLYGPLRKIPYNLGFIDSTFTFMCSDAFIVEKRFFDKWADYILDPETFNAEYYDSLVGSINLQLLNEQNEVMYEVDYMEAFPINVSAMNVGFAQMNEYAKFSVTFSYRKWKAKDIEFGPSFQQTLNPADRLQIPNSNQGG